ncbi:hypothetical protein GCM10027431_13490 [Lysobacter rhizosphaerae]
MRQPDLRGLGTRLAHIRAAASQKEHAEALGVPLRTYQNYERGEREPDARTLLAVHDKGWSLDWLLTGEGPEKTGGRVAESTGGYAQDLSEDALTIAYDFANKAIRARNVDLEWVPSALFAKLQKLLYEGLTRGLPMAEVRKIAEDGALAIERGMHGPGTE